jgi:superkiller protein 3
MQLGAVYLRQGQSKDAQEEFTTLVAQEPNNANAHVGLGMALADQNNPEAAINEYQAALRLEPDTRDAYYRMGVSQAQLRLYDDAIASYLKERERSGDDAELETSLADAYQAKGMTQQAQDARNRAAELNGGQRD